MDTGPVGQGVCASAEALRIVARVRTRVLQRESVFIADIVLPSC
jgi:hypothetical protein